MPVAFLKYRWVIAQGCRGFEQKALVSNCITGDERFDGKLLSQQLQTLYSLVEIKDFQTSFTNLIIL